MMGISGHAKVHCTFEITLNISIWEMKCLWLDSAPEISIGSEWTVKLEITNKIFMTLKKAEPVLQDVAVHKATKLFVLQSIKIV